MPPRWKVIKSYDDQDSCTTNDTIVLCRMSRQVKNKKKVEVLIQWLKMLLDELILKQP